MSTTCLTPSEIAAPQFARYQVNSIADLRDIPILPASFLSTTARFAVVGGYYAEGDGGGQDFTWDADSTETDNGGTVIKPTNITGAGRWLAVITFPLNARRFGLKPTVSTTADAIANNAVMQKILTYMATFGQTTLVISDGDYYIDCTYGSSILNVPSGATIKMGKRTRLFAKIPAGTTDSHIMFRINRASHVRISGGELLGDRNATGSGNSSAIAIYGLDYLGVQSTNITIENVIARDWKFDGLYIEDGSTIYVRNFHTYNCGRTGCALTRGSRFWFVDCIFDGTNGYSPEAGFNLETEDIVDNADVTDVFVSGCVFSNNDGHGFYCHKGVGGGKPNRVTVNSCTFDSNTGIHFSASICQDVNFTGKSYFRSGGNDNVFLDRITGGNLAGCGISGGVRGFYVLASTDLVLRDFVSSDTTDSAVEVRNDNRSTYPTRRIQVLDGNISESAEYGITITGDHCVAARNRVNRVDKDGILVNGFGNEVLHNRVACVSMVANDTYRGIIEVGANNRIVGNVVRKSEHSLAGTCQAGSASGTLVLAATAPAFTDLFKGKKVRITAGTGSGQTRYCTAYNSGTLTATITPAWTTTPDNTSQYEWLDVGDEGIADDAAKSQVPNLQKYGVFALGLNTFIHDNDLLLSGNTANLQNSATSSDAADNRS